MNYNHVIFEPQPDFSNYETYYLTFFDSSYSSAGPFGEPLQFHQEELPDESHSFSPQKEEVGGFLSGAWYSNGLANLLGYDSVESPYNDSSTWLDGYESYFGSCWEEGLVPHDYSYSSSETVGGSSEKADNAYLDGAETSLNQEVLPPAYDDDQWHVSSSFDFADGINEHCHHHGSKKTLSAHDNHWNETRLWESIFGHWPCLGRIDYEAVHD